ncbi:MAG: BMP family ABC transporter substrate-binding protein [Clostridia bacterium]|nr:BMP family ABC transporter substrate-binding protein [Clostridia bacterium]
MKKFLALVLSLMFVLSLVPMAHAEATKRIAVICDPIGTNLFLTQVKDTIEARAEELGYTYSLIECTDSDKWQSNYEAAAHEDYDLIIGVGWQSGSYAKENAEAGYGETQYAVIDTDAGSDAVASFSYNEEQAAFVMGLMAGKAFPEQEIYGYIGCFDGPGSWKYRFGFMEGVKITNPDAKFTFNWTNSYSDPTNAHEYALQMQAKGCTYIFGGAAACNEGIFQAALELAKEGKYIYSIAQDADATTPDNPYIISSQLKNTGVTTSIILDKFFAGELTTGLTELKLADGAIGATWVTNDGNFRNTEIMTDELIAFCQDYVAKIISGEYPFVLADEATYQFNIA